MVQKKFNVLQAVFAFTLMYTTIVSGILLRDTNRYWSDRSNSLNNVKVKK